VSFLDRLGTLAKADAHGVVDALEDRTLVLRQNLRDAATELDRKRARLDAIAAEQKALEREHQGLGDRLAELEVDVETALAGSADDLARFALRRLLTGRRRRIAISGRQRALAEEQRELAAALQAQQTAYEELEARVRSAIAQLHQGTAAIAEEPVTSEEVELELLRRRGRRVGGEVRGTTEEAGDETA
jgi:phage shock protein A